jgi:hypothetical protein
MAHQESSRSDASGHESRISIPPRDARQGRTGTRTLLVLTISLILAAVAGVALGVIPIGRF